MQLNLDTSSSTINTEKSKIFNESAKPILTTIDQLIKGNLKSDHYDFLELLISLEEHYLNDDVIKRTNEIREAFGKILDFPFYCNKDVLADFNSDLIEELTYCLKSEKKGGKGYFKNFNQFESFLGVKQNSLHQLLFDKTFNFKKVNKTSYIKLMNFLKLFSNINELNENLIKCSEIWVKKTPKNKLEAGALSIKLFEDINKHSYFNHTSIESSEIVICKNKFKLITINSDNVDIRRVSKDAKTPLELAIASGIDKH